MYTRFWRNSYWQSRKLSVY